MPIDYTKSARNQSAAAREPAAAEAPTLEAAVRAVLDDELYVLRAWVNDENLSDDERADAATRIPGIEKLETTVMSDATTWRYPMEWHEAIYQASIIAGYSVYTSTERAINLSYLPEEVASRHVARVLRAIADHKTHS
jgi:hypothetical protein